jgi:hypothetical protein
VIKPSVIVQFQVNSDFVLNCQDIIIKSIAILNILVVTVPKVIVTQNGKSIFYVNEVPIFIIKPRLKYTPSCVKMMSFTNNQIKFKVVVHEIIACYYVANLALSVFF